RGFANACRAMVRLHAEPLDPDLGKIRARALVISAERDFLCPPKAGEIIAAGIPAARLEVLPASGHQVPVECPAELSRAMLAFLEEGGWVEPRGMQVARQGLSGASGADRDRVGPNQTP